MSRKYYCHGHVMGAPGAVSSGTLRHEDLIKAFCDEIMRYRTVTPEVVSEGRNWLEGQPVYFDDDPRQLEAMNDAAWDQLGAEIVGALFDELNNMAPDGLEFGTQEGDGACFGWWEVHGEDEGDGDWDEPDEDEEEIPDGLYVKNNWGHLTWYWNGIEQSVHEIKRCKIKWPDGNVLLYDVHIWETVEQIYDHGHTSNVSQWWPIIVVDYRGQEISLIIGKHLPVNSVEMILV